MGEVVYSREQVNGAEIIRRTFSGRTTVEDVWNSFVYMVESGMITSECNGILTDLRKSTLDFSKESFRSLLGFLKSNRDLSGIRIAVVVDTSEKIVFPMMASNESGLNILPFSTEEAAISWITQ